MPHEQMEPVETELLRLVNQVRRNKGQGTLTGLEENLHLRDNLHFDSLDLAELTVRIEERFGVDVFEAGIVDHWGQIRERVIHHVKQGKSLG